MKETNGCSNGPTRGILQMGKSEGSFQWETQPVPFNEPTKWLVAMGQSEGMY